MNTILQTQNKKKVYCRYCTKQNVSLSRQFSPWGILLWLLTICQIHHHISDSESESESERDRV